MAKFMETTPEMEAEYVAWAESRPESIREIARRLKPWELYTLKGTQTLAGIQQRVTMHSISEDGTVTVHVTGQFNKIDHGRSVFGVNPADLEPCDLPKEGEDLGEEMTQEQVDANIHELRLQRRPDIWYKDAHGHIRDRRSGALSMPINPNGPWQKIGENGGNLTFH